MLASLHARINILLAFCISHKISLYDKELLIVVNHLTVNICEATMTKR